MKQVLFALMAMALIATLPSCAKCYVCKDKDGDEFEKFEICDKDFDKEDIDDAIDYYEDSGYKCHAKSRAL